MRKLFLCQASMLNHDQLNFSVGPGLVLKYYIEIHTFLEGIKVGLSPFKIFLLFCSNESPLNMIKIAFYVILKTFSFSRCLNFCHDFLVM